MLARQSVPLLTERQIQGSTWTKSDTCSTSLKAFDHKSSRRRWDYELGHAAASRDLSKSVKGPTGIARSWKLARRTINGLSSPKSENYCSQIARIIFYGSTTKNYSKVDVYLSTAVSGLCLPLETTAIIAALDTKDAGDAISLFTSSILQCYLKALLWDAIISVFGVAGNEKSTEELNRMESERALFLPIMSSSKLNDAARCGHFHNFIFLVDENTKKQELTTLLDVIRKIPQYNRFYSSTGRRVFAFVC